jgi:hypothetical protein
LTSYLPDESGDHYYACCRLFDDETRPEPRYWTLEGGTPRPCADASRSCERLDGTVGQLLAFTHLTSGPCGIGVITMFTGVALPSRENGAPLLFETRVLIDETGWALDACSREYPGLLHGDWPAYSTARDLSQRHSVRDRTELPAR